MRLLQLNDGDELHFSEDFTDNIPAYGILSHKWGADKDEITYNDVLNRSGKSKAGYNKVQFCGQQARNNGLQYFWVDTCCIDKQSSSELSEAINSMYNWYKSSQCCYVYLCDVDEDNGTTSFRASVWFTRGWTLQELLAPSLCLFFDRNWQLLGDRVSLAREIAEVTGIDVEALETGNLRRYSIAQKMSWAAKRHTKRTEDRAYSLMGLFEVNMPLLYGEGGKAFLRLQEEIIKDTDDHSIFAWSMGAVKFSGLMAPTPASFVGCERTIPWRSGRESQPFSMTNRGLSIRLQITPWTADTYLAYLECSTLKDLATSSRYVRIGIFLRRLTEDDQYARICFEGDDLWLDETNTSHNEDRPSSQRLLFVRKQVSSQEERHCSLDRPYGWEIPYAWLPLTAEIFVAHRLLDDHVAVLPPGGWGQTLAINVSAELKGLRHIILGFDFEFNPVCLLVDAFYGRNEFFTKQKDHLDWSNHFPDDFDWYEVHEGQVYRRKDHNGIWALKGDRLEGLDVTLSKSPSHNGTRLTLKRNEEYPFAWTVVVSDFAGPFATKENKEFEKGWGDRRNFQASYGLKATDKEDLEDGAAILDAMYNPFSPFGRLNRRKGA